MNDLNLDALINSLSEEAGLNKTASEKTEKEEKKDEQEAKDDVKQVKKDVEKTEKDIDGAKEKNDAEERTKEAAAKGAELAKEVMQKVASIKLDQVTTEDTMNKQAADAGKALAEALLEKLASVGDMNTTNGIASATPIKTQQDLAAQVAEQDAIIQNQPGTDGRGNGGTINQIFDAIVADAMARGAAPIDQNPQPGVAKDEGAINNQAPNQVQTGSYTVAGGEAQEKAAAVSALVEQGHDFEDAVNLVKAAAEEIEREEVAQVKQAALNHFMEAGFDFETAVNLVKKLG